MITLHASAFQFFSQKKVIQVAKSATGPAGSSPQKVTVVKSADGRVIVKTSENMEKEALTKVVNTVTSQPTPKTVIVSTVKTATSIVKEVMDEKKEVSPLKKEEPVPVKTPVKEPKKVSLYFDSICFIYFIFFYKLKVILIFLLLL
ncbi:hypothetical protein E2C01_086021 [Portunus trituberculatus]|uniref:Uncharacterized protein n=1 Tax=Portunus trituberculatus TaxID=210409 RepID=A0A5B7J964_PORTR|nr:hypothetical protein [Portunus trituberculatus]